MELPTGLRGPEWSAASVLRRRLGREVVERLVDPLLGGINAGSTDQLSLAVVAPQVAHALVGRTSVIRALRTPGPGTAPATSATFGATRSAAAPSSTEPLFVGVRGGLGRMVEALAADLQDRGVKLRPGAALTAIRRGKAGYELETADETVLADGVVLAVPGYVAARLLVDCVPAAGAELGSIPHASVALVTLAWPTGSIPRLTGSSGFLVPRCEGRLLTGCTVMSAKWPDSAPAGEVVLRASTGRYGDERSSAMTDDELVARALAELHELIGAPVSPLASLVQRWPRAFPQYLPGHLRKIDRAKAALSAFPALELAGASLGGIGVPACVTSGERAAASVLARLRE